MKRALLVLATVALPLSGFAIEAGCSSSSSPPVTSNGDSGAGGETGSPGRDSGTMAEASCIAPYDAAAYANSQCGKPGDKGNSLGVGSFCVTSNDCQCNVAASICSTLGGPGTDFCTILCTAPPDGGADGGDSGCGENATCVCQGGPCGCTPNSCL